jgi:hypothetical protein
LPRDYGVMRSLGIFDQHHPGATRHPSSVEEGTGLPRLPVESRVGRTRGSGGRLYFQSGSREARGPGNKLFSSRRTPRREESSVRHHRLRQSRHILDNKNRQCTDLCCVAGGIFCPRVGGAGGFSRVLLLRVCRSCEVPCECLCVQGNCGFDVFWPWPSPRGRRSSIPSLVFDQDHPVCANKEWAHCIDGAATPPLLRRGLDRGFVFVPSLAKEGWLRPSIKRREATLAGRRRGGLVKHAKPPYTCPRSAPYPLSIHRTS